MLSKSVTQHLKNQSSADNKPFQEYVQQTLFSNVPYSNSVPSRATSKQENDFIVAVRYGIQDYINRGGDYSEPITLDIDLKKLAFKKGLSRWESLQRSFTKTLNKIRKIPLNQVIRYTDEQGHQKVDTLWLLDKIEQDLTAGTVHVKIASGFQNYYVNQLLRHPEIQTDPNFFYTAKSSFTYPFANWLMSEVANRIVGGDTYPYHISISLRDLMIQVPPLSDNGRPSYYKTQVIQKAIDDINSNEYSQITIENYDDIVSKVVNRKIAEFTFVVTLKNRTPINNVSLLVGRSNTGLIDSDNIPSWSYLAGKMEELGFCKSQIQNWETRRGKVWRTLLVTWVNISRLRHSKPNDEIHSGAYLQTMLKHSLPPTPFKELARNVILNAPEFVDDVVIEASDSGQNKKVQQMTLQIDMNKPAKKQTVENNEFLREFYARNKK